jgi:metal-responsive CopG/Arc/MetJ family transcriptional regulator
MCKSMQGKRIVVTLSRELDHFLDDLVQKTGIDRTNLVRMLVWEKKEQERDRKIAEGKIMEAKRHK